MTLKIPTSIHGRNAKEDYERVISRTAPISPISPTLPRFQSTGELTFITDENLYKEIIGYMDKTFPAHKKNLSGKLSFDGVMKGSNPYIATAVDMFLKSANSKYRIATQRDLETNLQMFKDCYEDTGLVLRSAKNPNKDGAKYLYNQLKKTNSNLPIFLDLRGLELDANLNFNLTSQSKYKTAECLNWENGTKYSQIDDYGLPKTEDESSSRQIWTLKDGLVRWYLNRYLNLNSNDENLANSGDVGRVALAKSNGGIK